MPRHVDLERHLTDEALEARFRIGEWAVCTFGLLAVVMLLVFIMMLLMYRRDQP